MKTTDKNSLAYQREKMEKVNKILQESERLGYEKLLKFRSLWHEQKQQKL
jgi:hypothetical protein